MNIRLINLIFAFGLLCLQNTSYAQDPYPCVNGITTDFNNPVNPNLPLLPDGSGGNTDYLNRFNWVNGNNPNGNYTYLTNGMFFTENQPYGNMLNIKPLIIPPDEFYHYLFFSPGFTPNNGWELLLFNLGYYPNTDDGTLGGSIVPHTYEEQKFLPYIILYNKYSGVLRVFVAYGKNQRPDTWIDGVEIKLSFVKEENEELTTVSGLLRLGDGMDETLDQTTTSKELVAVAKNPGAENKWYSADFQLAYDPCTCEYPSRLAISFEFFKTSNLRLVGNSLSSNDIPMTQVEELIANDFLGNFELNENGNPENGFVIYNNLTKLMDDYLVQMEVYIDEYANYEQELKKYKRNYAIVNMAKNVLLLGTGAQFAGPLGINLGAASAAGVEWATLVMDGAKDIKDSKGIVRYTKLSSEAKKLLGTGFDMIMTEIMGDKPVPPNNPMPPSVSYSQMSFAGTIENRSKIGAIDFPNPGTFDNSVPITDQYDAQGNLQHAFPLEYKYPLYNEVLGVFALVKTPKFQMFNDKIDINHTNIHNPSSTGTESLIEGVSEIGFTNLIQLKFLEPLEYTFNPALDLTEENIDVSFELGGYFERSDHTYFAGYFDDPDHIVNWSIKTGFYEFPPIYSSLDGINTSSEFTLATNFFPIDAINEIVGSFSVSISNQFFGSTLEILLTYYAINTLGISSQEFWENITYEEALEIIINKFKWKFVPTHIDVKLNVNIFFDDQSNIDDKEYLYSLTYRLPITSEIISNLSTPIVGNIVGSSSDISQYPEDLNLVDFNFDGTEIEGCNLNGSTYLCKSWNNIEISGAINVAQGYEVNVEAGNEIYVVPETELPHEMQLSIVPVLDFSTPNPPMSSEQINHFCKQSNNLYQAHSLKEGKTIPTLEELYSNFISQPDPEPLEFSIFPNPTNGSAQALVSLPEMATVSITLIDLTGKVIGEPFQNTVMAAGRNFQNLQTEGLSPGVYFVHLVVNGEKYVERLVKR